MSEIIERVAKAMLDSPLDPVEPDTLRHLLGEYYASQIDGSVDAPGRKAVEEVAIKVAQFAIKALREPTEDILEAMSKAFSEEPSRDDATPHYLQRQKRVLNALIDAALK